MRRLPARSLASSVALSSSFSRDVKANMAMTMAVTPTTRMTRPMGESRKSSGFEPLLAVKFFQALVPVRVRGWATSF